MVIIREHMMAESFIVHTVEYNMLGTAVHRKTIYEGLPSVHRARNLIREWYGVKRFKTVAGGSIHIGKKRGFIGRRYFRLDFYIIPLDWELEVASY